jgi:hypothetical protein
LADTLDSLSSELFFRKSPVQVTTVCDGFVVVLQPLLPIEVAAFSVGVLLAYSTAATVAGFPNIVRAMPTDAHEVEMKSRRALFSLVKSVIGDNLVGFANRFSPQQFGKIAVTTIREWKT